MSNYDVSRCTIAHERSSAAVLIVFALTSGALLGTQRADYPDLHTILDTGVSLLSVVLAWQLWDTGTRVRRPFLTWLGISFAVTSFLELLHVLVTVEWSGHLAWIAGAAAVLRPSTWPPAAHVLPIGITISLWLLNREGRGAPAFAAVLVILSAALVALFVWLPRYTAPSFFGVTRPALILAPVLWLVVGWQCWRLRSIDPMLTQRILRPLALMAAVLFVAHAAMLYSRAPHDSEAMVAHLGKVGGYLILLMSLIQAASTDMLERTRAERRILELNEELERRVLERTTQLQSVNQTLQAEMAVRATVEQDLRDSHARMLAIFDTALDAIITMNQEGQIAEFNPAAERIFGYRRAEVLGRPLGDVIIPPAARERHRHGVARYVATGDVKVLGKRIEIEGLRADGTCIPVELSINRMPGAGPMLFAGFLRDITQRKHAEQKLRSQLDRLSLLQRITRAIAERQDLDSIFQVIIRSLEESLPIDFGCVCRYDAAAGSLTVTSVGARSRALALDLALTEKAPIDTSENGLRRCVQGQLVYEPDVGQVKLPLSQRLARGGMRSLVAAPLLVQNEVFGVLISARRQAHGFSSGECEFLKQLSEHAALAAHQAQLYGELQQAYDDLRRTQQSTMQQERLRALGQMASGIAHDINNALSPVALYTDALLEREPGLSERGREFLTTIQRAIGDVAATVARMREFYRPREPQGVLAHVNINLLVEQVIGLTRARWSDQPQHRGVGIELETRLAVELPPIPGAEAEIRDALTNLIFNAVDAMPEGGKLRICTKMLTGEGVDVTEASRPCVEVSDTGVGMSEEARKHCLEPFFSTKGERGTGLGLAMVYGMVQRHGGDLQIESELGRGTTMRLVFPAASAAMTPNVGAPEPQALMRRLRVLIVDDDPIVMEALRHSLRGDGHYVTAADGGQAGIDAFMAAEERGESFAIVFTDLGMPHVDGRKVAAAIRAASPTTPIVLLTGWGQRLASERDVPAEVSRLLSKPPKLGELRAALAELTQDVSTHQ